MRGTWQTTDSGGGTGLAVAVIIALVLLGSGVASAAASALASLLVTLAIVLGSVIGLAVLGGIGWLAYRARSGLTRSDRPGRPIEARPVVQLPPVPRPDLSPPYKAAIEPGREIHLHFHGLTPEQIAAIVTQRGAYLEGDQ